MNDVTTQSDDLTILLGCTTDVGKVREVNQDCFACSPEDGIYLVADGMGGHLAGEKAAQTAVEVLASTMVDRVGSGTADAPALVQAFLEANRQIVQASLSDATMRGMGTTATMAMVVGDQVIIGHVGDSRAYLIRGGEIEQITEDHSVVAQLLKAGAITPLEALHHPYRNVITRCLGMQMDLEPDTHQFPWQPGDRVLLCTDGLSGLVNDDEMRDVALEEADPQDACQRLLDLAMERGGYDNITIVLVQLPA